MGRGNTEVKRDMERGRDEVRVMTVHGAKGLEADIVILPDTTTLPDPPSRKGHLLYQGDGVLFPLAVPEAPQVVSAGKTSRAGGNARRASPASLCGAHPRPRAALCLRLREQARPARRVLV